MVAEKHIIFTKWVNTIISTATVSISLKVKMSSNNY